MKKSPTLLKYIIVTYPIWDILYSLSSEYFSFNLPINQVARVLILIYLLRHLSSKKNIVVILAFIILLVGSEMYHSTIPFLGDGLGSNFGYALKLLFFVVVVFSFQDLFKSKKLDPTYFLHLLVSSSIVIYASIILSRFGLGYQSFAGSDGLRSGVKGLFAVQNTINVTLLLILPLCFLLYQLTKKKIYIFHGIMIIASLFLLGTKSGLVGAILVVVLQLGLFSLNTKLSYFKIFIGSLVSLGFLGFLFYSYHHIVRFVESQIRLYEAYNYTNLYSFIISNRDLQIMYISDFLSLLEKKYISLFGIGYEQANFIVNNGKSDFYAVEMDFHGIYYYSGLLILLFIVVIILSNIFKPAFRFIKNPIDLKFMTLFLCLSIGIVHAYLGGHVIYEALSLLYFGSLLSCSNYLADENPKDIRSNSELKKVS